AGDRSVVLAAGRGETPGDEVVALAGRGDRLDRHAIPAHGRAGGDVGRVVDRHHVQADGRADARVRVLEVDRGADRERVGLGEALGADLDRAGGREVHRADGRGVVLNDPVDRDGGGDADTAAAVA